MNLTIVNFQPDESIQRMWVFVIGFFAFFQLFPPQVLGWEGRLGRHEDIKSAIFVLVFL